MSVPIAFDFTSLPVREVADIYDALTVTFRTTDAKMDAACLAMIHKQANILAATTDTEEEAKALADQIAAEILNQLPMYRLQIGKPQGSV